MERLDHDTNQCTGYLQDLVYWAPDLATQNHPGGQEKKAEGEIQPRMDRNHAAYRFQRGLPAPPRQAGRPPEPDRAMLERTRDAARARAGWLAGSDITPRSATRVHGDGLMCVDVLWSCRAFLADLPRAVVGGPPSGWRGQWLG
ncbi:hypothetical protein VMCG_02514 [Cytospora schulzeri]|uniref:Uncharacterized protein n=1 Tax=Cytospora schulzeri TaxID=448051 RepID=A0A423X1F0_9PEZI|nr:hypothetical protein VMCG_02514 [Valsa malicola]